MDFGDDPLADILSDGSNDSFFDEPKPAAKRGSLTKTPEKKSITDLFNISDKPAESSQAPKRSDDWLGLDSRDTKSPSRSQKLTKKISFDDDDDILGNLGLTKKPQSKTEAPTEESKVGKKMDLLESILGPSKSENSVKKPSFGDILKESKSNTAAASTPLTAKPSPTPGVDLQFTEAPREGRRGRRQSGGLLDPLGLFSNEPMSTPKQDDTVVPKEKVVLGGSDEAPVSKPVYSKSTPNISDQGIFDCCSVD
jgi:hypothetical protein